MQELGIIAVIHGSYDAGVLNSEALYRFSGMATFRAYPNRR